MRLSSLFLPALLMGFALQAQDVSWAPKKGPVGGAVTDIEVIPGTDTVLLIDSNKRPFVSFNAGAAWEKIPFESGSQRYFEDIEIIGNTVFLVGNYDLYASIDGGHSFVPRMNEESQYNQGYRMKRLPVSGAFVALGFNGLYKSNDQGVTWSPGAALTGLDQARHLVVNAVDQIFVLKQNDLFEVRPFRSADGGDSFVEASSGIPAGHHVLSLSSQNDGSKIYCVTSTDVFVSADGSSWTSIKNGTITDTNIADYRPSTGYIEFSADGLGMFYIDNLNHKLHSKGVGETSWTLRSGSFPTGTQTATCFAALNYPSSTTATAFAGTPTGVYKTITGGASVSATNSGLANLSSRAIIEQGGILYLGIDDPASGRYSDLLRSIDQGNNWSKLNGLPSPFRSFFSNQAALFVLDQTLTLHRSFNDGASWFALSPSSGGFVWAGGVGESKVFGLANSSSSFYYSKDNGGTWTPTAIAITGMPASASISDDRIFLASENRMLLHLWDGSSWAYYNVDFTYDASDNLTLAVASKITTIPIAYDDIEEVFAADGKYYVFDNYGATADRLAVSSDGGASWSSPTLPECDDMFVLKNGYILTVDGNNGLFLSRDDGASFAQTIVPASADLFYLEDATLDNNGLAYLAFDGDYVYQSRKTIALPDPLSNLEVVAHTGTAVALRWDDANYYDHDIVIQRSLNGSDFTEAGRVYGYDNCGSKGYFVDSGLQPSTAYTYRIQARNDAGESAPSSTAAVTTLADCGIDLPANGSWTAINSGTESYSLLGAAVEVGIRHLGGGKYQISNLSLGLTGSAERSTFYVSCGETMIGDAGDLSPNGNGTWNGTTLTLKWRNCADNNTETISLTPSAVDAVPLAPASLHGYVVSNASIELKWPAGYNESSYILERSSTGPASGFAVIAEPAYPETTFNDNGPLSEGTTYYYRVRSRNSNTPADESPSSAVAAVPFRKPNFVVAENTITGFKMAATLGSLWADFNNDGLEDYLTMRYDAARDEASPILFKNLGTDFELVIPTFGNQSYLFPSVADFDNDGNADIALAGDGALVLDIWRGNGDFTFSLVPSGQLGDLGILNNEISATSWADINNDGLPDVVALHQDDGAFTVYRQNNDHSFSSTFRGDPSEDESVLAVWADYNSDGFQDFLKGNLDGSGGLYRNNGNETFTRITGNGFNAANFFTAAWGDYNNDGHMDLFCGSISNNQLFKNNGNGTFTEDASTSITEPNFCTSASWGDFNNDGFLDLMTVGFAGAQSRLFMRNPAITGSVVFQKITTEKINDLAVSHYSVAGADYDGNGLIDLAASAFIFDDENNDAILPTNNNFYQNNNLVRNWSQVILLPDNGSEALGAKISLTSGGVTQTRELSSQTSLVSRNSTVAHFGLGANTSINNIQVRWPNGSVQNYPLPPANQVLLIDEDVAGPGITSRIPVHNAADVAANTTITITFDENNLPVPGKKLYVTKTGESSPSASIDVANAAKTDKQYVFTLPAPLQPLTEYNITLDPGAFRDRYANGSAGITAGQWVFTTASEPDSQAPQITFTPPPAQAKGFVSVNAGMTVTDNQDVSTVVVSIRKISGSEYAQVNATEGASNSWTVPIAEADHFDAIGTEFYITATDMNGNTKRSPEGTGTYKVYLKYNATQAAIPTTSLGIGGTKGSWKVFAIPFGLSSPNNEITSIFEEFSELTNKSDYRLITLASNTSWSEYDNAFTTIARGSGYFINFKSNPGAIDLFDDLIPPENSRSALFQMNLKAGWNMIGNPYLTPISWDDVAELNGLTGTEAQLKKYGNGAYSNNQSLQPYEGGFVLVEANKTISIPFINQTSSGGRRGVKQLGPDINEEAWAIPLTVRQEGVEYGLGGIGMAPDADHGIDNYDDVTPPRFIDYIELNFDHPEHIAKRFTRDIVPTSNQHTWNFSIDSNLGGMAELKWDNTALANASKDIFLLDVATEELVDMKETGIHRFEPGGSARFRIFYGDNLSLAPESAHLGKAFPNPTDGVTTIAFSLPETGGMNQSVTLDVVDAMGRTVGTVFQGRLNPGYYETGFDAAQLTRGFFTCRLTIKHGRGQTVEVNKLIIK